MALSDLQKAFALEYIATPNNAYAAALRAGYKKSSAKDASKWINPELLKNPNEKEQKKFKQELYDFIRAELDKKEAELVASGDEVLKYLTSVMRGNSESSVLARQDDGSEHVIEKKPDEKERLKAAELLGKVHMLFTEKVQQEIDAELSITIDYGDDVP